MLVFSLGCGRMKIFTRKEPVYEYEFIYNGEKMIADRCSGRLCVKDERTYENVQWTSKIVGYKDVDYTPLVLSILIPIGFMFIFTLLSLVLTWRYEDVN